MQGGPSSGELFVLYVNSLPVNQIQKSIKKTKQKTTTPNTPINDASSNEFVDDLNSVISAKNETDLNIKIQAEFMRIHEYLVTHKMKINCEKTQLMYLNPSKTQKKFPLSLNGTLIQNQEQIRILGFNIAANLKYDAHIKTGKINMIRSINSKMSMLRTVRNQIPMKSLALVANNLINSTIQYGAAIWGSTTNSNKEMLQKSQTKCARLVLKQNWAGARKMHRQTALNKLKWNNVNQIAEMALLNLIKRAITGNASQGLKEMFSVSTPRHPRGLKTITIKHKGNNQVKESNFSVNACTRFNKLPPELRDPDLSCKAFKTALKRYINTTMLLKQHNIDS